MRIRLGYVSLALNLDKVTSSSTLTYARYQKLNKTEQLDKLKAVTLSNTDALLETLRYNVSRNVHFFRMTSKLIPLATHPDVLWEWKKFFAKDLSYIGDYIKEHDLRVDSHPDQFDVLNSHRPDVVVKTEIDLQMHNDIFDFMGLSPREAKTVLHVGSRQGGKEDAMERFIYNFNKMPTCIQDRLILENDDKVYTIKDVCAINSKINVPIVLDIHHHNCIPCEEELHEYLPQVLDSWNKEDLCPKMHLSSPKKNATNMRHHSEFIRVEDFLALIEYLKPYNRDVDIMLECKKKDQALFQLVEDTKERMPDWKWADETTLIIEE